MEQLNSTMFAPNISSTPGPPLSASLNLHSPQSTVTLVVMSVCFLLGFPGNIAVIIFKLKQEHLTSVSQSLMLNLAVSDLLCLLTLPVWIYTYLESWTFGLVACKILVYLLFCSIYGSMLTVTALSVQRYIQVVYLQRSLQEGKKRLLALIWLVAIILSIHVSVLSQLTTDLPSTQCRFNVSSPSQVLAVLITESLTGFASFSVIASAYINLHRKLNQTAFFNNPQTTRLVTSIVVTLFFLWIPFLILNVFGIAAFLLEDNGLVKFYLETRDILGALTFINSCLNPLLYAFAFASRNICTLCQIWKQRCCC